MIFSKLGIGIGARVVERLAARLIREGKLKRKTQDEVFRLWRSGMSYEQARKELRR